MKIFNSVLVWLLLLVGTAAAFSGSGGGGSGSGSGTVTSVSGTANQVAVATGTTTPVISLIGPYTPATYTVHGVLIGEAASGIGVTAAGALDTLLQGQGASTDPAYVAVTSCSTASSALTYNTTTHAFGCNTISGSGTVNSGTAGQMAYYATSTTAVSGNANANISAGALTLGVLNTTLGDLILDGSTSGAITIQPQAAAGTFNFNLPTTAGTSGQALLSGGGVGAPMTWGTLTTGTVTSVSGTANQVSVATGTTTPVISLVGPYTPSTYTAHGILIGEGASSIVPTAVCGTGSVLYGQAAADPVCSTLIYLNAMTTGDLVSASSTNTQSRIADVAVGQFLASGGAGVLPAYAALTAINPQTTTYQVLASDFSSYKTITVASGTFTITLVASGSQPAAGQYINVINYGSGVVTIARSGQNINGAAANLTLVAGTAANPSTSLIVSDGTNYFATVEGAATGTVTSVSGTANQVSVATGTTTPVISLIGPYTPATYTAHGNLIGEGTSSIVAMAVCGTGSIFYGQAAADPVCSTLIYPNAATAGDLIAATSTNTLGSVADVAVGRVLTSGGAGVVPAYSATPTLGVGGTTTGTLTLSNATGAGTFTLASAPTTTTWTETKAAVVPAQGDLLTFSNGTGQDASVVDVAVGRVLVSAGVGAAPTYSATPVLGVGGTTSGTLTLSNATGAGTYTLASAATTTTYTETAKAVVPAQGDILDYSNASGQRSSLVDVAIGQVLTSGGVGAVPVYSATPNVTSISTGTNPNCTAGTGGVLCATEGTASTGLAATDELYADSTAHRWLQINNNGTAAQLVASGVDINTSDQVTATHLSAALPIAQGGTAKTTGATSFCMGTSANIATATTDFIACGENPGVTVIATETNDQMLIPAVCTISNLSVKLTTAANTNTPVITVDKNTTGQTLTCTVANTATTCTDVTHSFTTAAGDLLSVKVANPTSAAATGVVYMAFQINC